MSLRKKEKGENKKKGCDLMNNRKKVLVVDDSAFMRRIISDIINSDARCEVIGTANNGQDGLEKVKHLKPDVITLDIEMPIMNGLEMLKQLKQRSSIPVILMSTLAKEGAAETIQALELGAIDFITKPENIFKVNTEEIKNNLVDKIIMASKAKKIKVLQKPIAIPIKQHMTTKMIKKSTTKINNIVAIGCSTGGPRALQYVIPYLPMNINAGIVIVQHMPPGFTHSLAKRLDHLSEIKVKEAEDNDVINNGTAYIAPGDRHIKVVESHGEYIIKLSDDLPKNGHKPAVDVMMNSLTSIKLNQMVGVIMTGMGADGSDGLEKLKTKNKLHVIAQNEETCVVYGMPKVVVQKGIADEVIPLDSISSSIIKKTGVL